MYSTNNSAFRPLFYFNLVFGILFIIIGILSFLSLIDGGKSVSIIFSILGLILIIRTLIQANRLVTIKLTEDEIFISFNGKKIKKEWGDLNKINKHYFNSVPLYSMKFKNDKKKYYFTAERSGPVPKGCLWDFIKRKKSEIDSLKPKDK